MPYYSFRSKASKKKKKSRIDPVLISAAGWVGVFLGTLYVTWALCFTASSGWVGSWIAGGMTSFFGYSAYLLPFFLAYGLILYFTTDKGSGYITYGLGSALTWMSAATLLAMAGTARSHPAWGGEIGADIYSFLGGTVGSAGAAFAALACGVIGLKALFGISWRQTIRRLLVALRQDYAEWTRARREFKEQVRQAAGKLRIESAGPVPAIAKATTASTGATGAFQTTGGNGVAELPPIERPKAAAGPKPVKAAAPAKTKPTEAYKNYQLPPLEL